MSGDPELGNQSINATLMYNEWNHDDEPGFDERADPLWSFYGTVAKKEDKATLDEVTNDMNSLLLFVGPLSFILPLLCASSC